ncbi:MAG: DNA-binding response regulator [Rhodocyclaceae bacterium]|nr:DNA-binding response regulator [Rhodocyclaceae bacterium]
MLIIATASTHRMACWKDGLYGTDDIVEVTESSSLKTCLARHTPQVLLIDLEFPGLGNPAASIRKLRQACPATKIVVLGQTASDDLEITLFMAGVRGCCDAEVECQTLQRVVAAVRQGEPWIRRTLIPRLLDELTARALGEPSRLFSDKGRSAELSRREQQIAALARDGESSKQIASELNMAEPTVKAYLTGILRKLGMDDRLKLSLMMNIGTES